MPELHHAQDNLLPVHVHAFSDDCIINTAILFKYLIFWIFYPFTEKLQWLKHSIDSEVMTPAGRRGHSAVICNNAMHIYGGYQDLKGSSSELWTFDFGKQYFLCGFFASIKGMNHQ